MSERREKSGWDDLARLLGADAGEGSAESDAKDASIDSTPSTVTKADAVAESIDDEHDAVSATSTVRPAAAGQSSVAPTATTSKSKTTGGNRRRDGWSARAEATPTAGWGSLAGELGLSLPPAPPSEFDAQRTADSANATSERGAELQTDSLPGARDPHSRRGSTETTSPSSRDDVGEGSVKSERDDTEKTSPEEGENVDGRPKRRRRRRGRGRQRESRSEGGAGEDDKSDDDQIDDVSIVPEEKAKQDREDDSDAAPKRRRRRGRRRPRQSSDEAAASLETPRSTEWLDESQEAVGGDADYDESKPEQLSCDSEEDSSDEEPKAAGRSRRRRGGRRRGGRAGRETSSADAASGEATRRDPSNAVGAAKDASDGDDDDDDMEIDIDMDDESDNTPRRSNHKNIPSWEETIAVMVDLNLASRSSSPGKGSPRAGARGRSRGRRKE